MADKAKVLVVANRTAGSPELLDALRERADDGPAEFHLVVPASPRGASWMFDMNSGHDAAEHDLEGALARIRARGIEVEGEVGDPDPTAAASDSAHAGSYDEVIVSTLPQHLSKWLKLDVTRKIAHSTGLPVTHVVAHSGSKSAA
jgi:nucleotide-binding universal stress UspA family protein